MKLQLDYSVHRIDAYSDEGEAAKTAFLKDAKRYLNALGKSLGWPSGCPRAKTGIQVNQAGIGVSGEVTATFCPSGGTWGVFVCIDASGNEDYWDLGSKNIVRVYYHLKELPIGKTGPNCWPNPAQSAAELANELQAHWLARLGRRPSTSATHPLSEPILSRPVATPIPLFNFALPTDTQAVS